MYRRPFSTAVPWFVLAGKLAPAGTCCVQVVPSVDVQTSATPPPPLSPPVSHIAPLRTVTLCPSRPENAGLAVAFTQVVPSVVYQTSFA